MVSILPATLEVIGGRTEYKGVCQLLVNDGQAWVPLLWLGIVPESRNE